MEMPQGEPKRQAIIRVSRELLRQVLCLPDGVRVIGVSDQIYFDCDQIAIKVESKDFSPVYEGDALPQIQPLLSEVRTVKFVGWGK